MLIAIQLSWLETPTMLPVQVSKDQVTSEMSEMSSVVNVLL